jgi:hypothetical protein
MSLHLFWILAGPTILQFGRAALLAILDWFIVDVADNHGGGKK